MSFPPIFAGKRFAVVGLGRAGLPATSALAAMGAEVFAWDDSETSRAAAGNLMLCPPSAITGHLDAVILSPGIAHALPKPHPEAAWARANNVPILTDAELLFQAVRAAGSKARFAGITGTNGKSTTTALLAHILSEAGVPNAAGANLGPAALSLPLLPDDGVYVLEMSSYMLERIATLRFDVASMLNLSPDHLDRHGSMEGYAHAKREIFARQDSFCLAIVGVDDALSAEIARSLRNAPGKLVEISGAAFPHPRGTALPGVHNAQNAAAAFAMAAALGVDEATIKQGLLSFPGLPHRQQFISKIDGIALINDSKATNADATARAFTCYKRFVWIAGGIAKNGGIAPLAPFFPQISKAFLIGRDAPAMAETLAQHDVAYDISGTLPNALKLAYAHAKQTAVSTILFSPAAASFDQYENFEARGEHFVSLAKELA